MSLNLPQGMQINAPLQPGYESILTLEALEFVAKLRDEEKFTDLAALTAQMQRDAVQARAALHQPFGLDGPPARPHAPPPVRR